MTSYDFAIIGAGIAGASLAAELTDGGANVLMLEAEERPGYHATGRSAAFWEECYGGPEIVPLTLASGAYLRDGGFLHQRGALYIGREGDEELVTQFMQRFVPTGATIQHLGRAELQRRIGGIRHDWSDAIWEPMCADIDVARLHAHFLAQAQGGGASLECRARLVNATRADGQWTLTTERGETHHAAVLVNAAGAWVDEIAGLAQVKPISIRPLRRTVITFDVPIDVSTWPFTKTVGPGFYIEPEGAGRLLACPMDEGTSAPCDAQPEDEDVARAAWEVEQATTLTIPRLASKWAGLRSFTPDRLPIASFDSHAPDFFWLAGQGGFGLQTSPAMALAAEALVTRSAWPGELRTVNVRPEDLSLMRLN